MARRVFCWGLLFLFLTTGSHAAIDSVLDVVPAGSAAMVYLPSLRALSDEIDDFVAALMPENPPQNILAHQLANLFGAQFNSIDELRSIGVDPGKDFAVFWNSTRLQRPTAIVHILNRNTIEQIIQEHAGTGEEVPYGKATYEKTAEGTVLFVDDVMVFSPDESACRKIIDVFSGDADPIRKDQNYTSLQLDTKVADITGYLAMDQLATAYQPLLAMSAEDFQHKVAEEMDQAPEGVPAEFGKSMLKAEAELGLWLMQQMKGLGLILSLDGTDIELRTLTQFVDGSPMKDLFNDAPRQLEIVKLMPANSFVVAGGLYDARKWQEASVALMTAYINSLETGNKDDIARNVSQLMEMMKPFADKMGDELGMALRFGETMFPDVVAVYETEDSRAMLDAGLKMLPEAASLYREVGMTDIADIMQNTKPTVAESYQGSDIMSWEMPMQPMGNIPEQVQGMVPEKWTMWYAPTDKHLVYGMSSTSDIVKEQIDALGGSGGTFAQWLEDTALSRKAPQKANWVAFISPIAGLKSAIGIISETQPQMGMMGMFLENIPSTFSIIASGSNLKQGQEFKLQISAGDFRELIGMIAVMASM